MSVVRVNLVVWKTNWSARLTLPMFEPRRHLGSEEHTGCAFLEKPERVPSYIYGARDRMDERYDIIRSVRDQRYRYIRN